MRKNQIRGLLFLGIVAVVYSVVVFAVPFTKDGVFWLSYIFTILSLVCMGYSAYKAFCQGQGVRSKFYGFPIVKIGVLYFLAQVVLGIVFMSIPATPFWLPVVLYIVLLGIAAIGLIATDAVREEIHRQDANLVKDISTMRTMQSKASALTRLCEDMELRKAVEKFAENIRFSDPVSCDELHDTESELITCMGELENAILEGDSTIAITFCAKAESILAERNRLCKLNKHGN